MMFSVILLLCFILYFVSLHYTIKAANNTELLTQLVMDIKGIQLAFNNTRRT